MSGFDKLEYFVEKNPKQCNGSFQAKIVIGVIYQELEHIP